MNIEVAKCKENIHSLSAQEKFIVAKRNDEVVGLIYLEKDKSNILHALYVIPKFQGHGIGTKLWKSVSDFLDRSKDIYLQVLSSNKSAISFYKKLGFELTGKKSINELFRSESGIDVEESEMVLKV